MTEYTEATLTETIHDTWPMTVMQPRYVVGVQVNNGAGFAYSRTLDAIVFDTWPSGGLYLHGMEIKISKADLRHELQDTQKFAAFAPYLDLFSIIAPPGMADLKLLPPKWGLYIPTDNGKLRARRKPLMLHDEGKRKTVNRSLAAAFVRAVVSRSLSHEAKRAEYDRGYKRGKEQAQYHTKGLEQDVSQYKEAIESFEEKSGIDFIRYNAGRIGEAVKVVLGGGIEQRIGYAGNVRNLGERLIKLADELDELKEAYSQ